MRWFPAAIVALLALAGCSDQPSAEAAEGGGTTTAPAGQGAMAGIVVDEAVRPLRGANVTAIGPSGTLAAETAEDGTFRFADLAAGVYLVEVRKEFYIGQQQAVTVVEGVEPAAPRFQLTFEASQVPYANVYKLEGFYECGVHPYHVCANINIATWIVLCANTGVCVGNVTQDRSLLFQPVEPGLDFLQGELTWTPTSATGEVLALLLGGGNEAELKAGMAPAYNMTTGRSPLLARITNHEGDGSWCSQQEDCPTPDTLNQSGIGAARSLLVQVATGPTVTTPACGTVDPCAAGLAFQQPFTLFTTTFYGYEPPMDWMFATSGAPPPPPN